MKKVKAYLLNDGSNSRLLKVTALLFAFFVPFVAAILLFRANNYYPFVKDGHSLMMVDMSGQYIAFFRYYKQILDGNYDLFYTLGKVTGGEFISIFLYYLVSPFNLLLKFYSLAEIPKALMWIVILKIATAGLTSYFVFTKTNTNGYKNLIFSISYALMAYSFVYYSNIMWLDSLYLLPLVAYGIVKIVKDESPLLYILSLAMTIVTSWYIAIMIAIFSVFFFFVLFNDAFRRWRDDRRRVLIFAVGSLAAGLMSFAFWGTALFTILGTKGGSSFTNLPQTIFEFFEFAQIEKGFFANSFAGFTDISGSATTVSFYVGVLPTILTILYFFQKDTNYRQKAGVLVLFAIYILAFNNVGINHLFHGGPAPNWFPTRFAFIFGFLLSFYGAQTFVHLREVHWAGFIAPPLIAIILFSLIRSDEYTFKHTGYLYFIIAILLLVLYYALIKFVLPSIKKNEKRWVSFSIKMLSPTLILMLLAVATLNVYGNNHHILATYNEPINRHKDYSVYAEDEKISDTINYIKGYDNGLYRMEKSFLRSGTYNIADNDALYYGYNGISHFSSNEKRSTNEYMKKIGFHYNGFNLNFGSGSTLAVNSYLGVKYFVDNGANDSFHLADYLDRIDNPNGTYQVYENKYALPFLFATTKQSEKHIGEGYYDNDGDIYWYDKFEYQNNIYKNLTNKVVDEFGNQKDIFKKATVIETLNGVEKLASENHYKVVTTGVIKYKIETPQAYNYYYYIDAKSLVHDNAPTLSLRVNSRSITYFSYHSYQINGLDSSKTTSTIDVHIAGTTQDVEVRPQIYYEDTSVLAEYIDAIKNEAVISDLRQFKTSKYHASIDTLYAEQTMLLTFPYSRNFKVYVDGKKVKTTTSFNIYTSFNIKQAGTHTLLIKYFQPSFQLGVPIGIFVLGATIFAHFKLKYIFKKEEA